MRAVENSYILSQKGEYEIAGKTFPRHFWNKKRRFKERAALRFWWQLWFLVIFRVTLHFSAGIDGRDVWRNIREISGPWPSPDHGMQVLMLWFEYGNSSPSSADFIYDTLKPGSRAEPGCLWRGLEEYIDCLRKWTMKLRNRRRNIRYDNGYIYIFMVIV